MATNSNPIPLADSVRYSRGHCSAAGASVAPAEDHRRVRARVVCMALGEERGFLARIRRRLLSIAALQASLVSIAVVLAGCVSTAPIPTEYQGDLFLKHDGYISGCTQWTSTYHAWFTGPVPVTCLLVGSGKNAPRPAGEVIPAGTKVRILSFQDFNGGDAQSKVVQARVYVDGREIDVYLDWFHRGDYF